jgi:hypothetical protein
MPRPSPAERGYDANHRRLRRKVKREVEAGQAYCWRCLSEGKTREQAFIPPGSQFHLGHDDHDRSIYRGAEHVACNVAVMAHRPPRERSSESHPGLIG